MLKSEKTIKDNRKPDDIKLRTVDLQNVLQINSLANSRLFVCFCFIFFFTLGSHSPSIIALENHSNFCLAKHQSQAAEVYGIRI